VAEAIDRIADIQGDSAEAVGDERGAGGKKGDIVVGLDGCSGPAQGFIVFEAKDKQLSKPAFRSELAAAMEQRGALYSVLVVPTPDEVPARLHPLREYDGDKLIAVFDPDDGSTLELEYAYRIARVRVAASRDDASEIDAAALRAIVGRADAAMADVRKVKTGLTNADTGIQSARAAVEALEASVRGELSALDALLAPAAPQDTFPIS
jgi:hypothetical protein